MKILELITPKLCACGCGDSTKKSQNYLGYNKYIHGHHPRGKHWAKAKSPSQLCGCGCGEMTKPGNRFISNHPRRKTRTKEWRSNISLGHGGSGILKDESIVECLCGCGKLTQKGKKYIHGHNRRNVVCLVNTRKKLSESKTGDKNPAKRPEIRKRISTSILKLELKGEKAPNWQGGLSLIPYTQDWTEDLRDAIRKRDNYLCQICSAEQKDLNKKLSVHHINYEKENCDPNNLICLCRNCHIKTNYYRKKWRAFFEEKIRLKGAFNE